MIQTVGIRKSFGDINVLRGIDLTVNQGEIISIIGKSGAGKSTLLHIIGTLESIDQGELTILNKKINGLGEKELAAFRNNNIGFVFQFHHLLKEFTALENVCIPAYIAKKDVKKTNQKAKELLDYLGLKDRIHHKPNQLSGGEAQRVSIARALINNPPLVLADEPTGNLDISNSEMLHQLFLNLRRDFGLTFVIVTHHQELALLSDKIITMEDGVVKNDAV